MQINVGIVGAGIIGSAIAFELSRRGVTGIHVYDPDLEGSLSSTERNAGGVRHLWQHPINIELSRASISLFERIREEIGFQQTGYLWLFEKEKATQGETLLAHTKKSHLNYEQWSVSDIRNRYPFIDKTDDLAFGLFGPKDGVINSNALKNFYRSESKKKGVVFHDRSWVTRISERNSVHFHVHEPESSEQALKLLRDPRVEKQTEMAREAKSLILSAGAWMSELLNPLLPTTEVKPVRRQISIFKAENFDMTPYGMVVDTSRVYFHPEGGNMLGGFVLKAETPGFRFEYDNDFFENFIWPPLFERSTCFERLKHISGWAGLYSYTPDTSGILGRLQGYKNIFEAHSFTGRGIMQSYGAAVALAELMMDGSYRTIDASYLSRERFSDEKRLLRENLHI